MKSIAKIALIRGGASVLRLAIIAGLPLFFSELLFQDLIWIITAIFIFSSFSSFEVYTYTNRRFLKKSNLTREYDCLLVSSVLVPIIGGVFISPFFISFAYYSDFSASFFTLISIIVLYILESIQNEIMRVFVVIDKQYQASLIYLSRQVILLITLIAVYFFDHVYQSDKEFYAFITINLFLNAGLITACLYKLGEKSAINLKYTAIYLKEGLSEIKNYLSIGVLSKLQINGDRLLASIFLDGELFAVYAYFISLLNGAASFIEPLLNQIIMPRVIGSDDMKEKTEYLWRGLKWLFVYLMLSLLLIELFLAFSSKWLGHNAKDIYFVVATFYFTLCAANYSKFVSYCLGEDRALLHASFYSLVAVITGIIILFYFEIGTLFNLFCVLTISTIIVLIKLTWNIRHVEKYI